MTSSSEDLEQRKARNTATHWVLGGLAVAALIGLIAFLLLGNLLEETTETRPVEDVEEGAVSEEAFAAVEVGDTKEDVTTALRPALPVDTRVLSQYELREPETPSSSCVYYETELGEADDLYRFCFVEDELVDKTVILPDQPGVAG